MTPTRNYTAEPAAAAVELGKQTRRLAPISKILQAITVGRMLDYKAQPSALYEVNENDRVIKAIEVMLEQDIGSVLVRANASSMRVGIITKEDCMQKMVLQGRFARNTDVKDIMKVNFPCVTRDFTLAQCIEMMSVRPGPVRYLPVVTNLGELDGDSKVMGMISEREIITWFVRAFLDAADTDVVDGEANLREICSAEHGYENGAFIQESDTVYEALKLLSTSTYQRKATGAIVTRAHEVVGLFTGTDYLRGIVKPGLRSKDVLVGDIMTRNLVVAPPHYSLLDCLNLMLKHNVHHLPVVDYLVEGSETKEGGILFNTESRQSMALLTASDMIAFVGNQAKFLG